MKENLEDRLPCRVPVNFPAYLAEGGEFRLDRLALKDIDNTPVLKMNDPRMAAEEICLFHQDYVGGDDYLAALHRAVSRGIADHQGLPVVRFADGEYAFYGGRLDCNGLYQQAESRAAIKKALPSHIRALRLVARSGILAPLIFPGNTGTAKGRFWPALPWKKEISSAQFLTFLHEHGVDLSTRNYIPFYIVYAYLTSADFARLVHGRKICILNSEYNAAGCRRWFDRFSSRPDIVYCPIPAAYLATRWNEVREDILANVPPGTELCLVGAGVGALTVSVDVAERFSVPVLDAGHVLNMMNEREDKSKGPRLFTLRRET